MTLSTSTKEQAREFILSRSKAHNTPLPSMSDIRRAMGWDLIQAKRDAK